MTYAMNKLLEGLRTFQDSVYPKNANAFRKLADQQHPLAAMITCADSRIVTSLLLQCDPGGMPETSRRPTTRM